uniref:Uncharacterized protein n=1 Tax=Vespula pensylvanica TaxID=30213 RepID=A0A834JS32_VESPE|nr:hypothetical protein H0235_017688 [Vespula pensylvanica]
MGNGTSRRYRGVPKRATLAEKEVSALKEQLATANDGNSKTEGHQLSQTSQGSDQQQQHDASNPRRTPNSNLEQELQAKDKENRTFDEDRKSSNDCVCRDTSSARHLGLSVPVARVVKTAECDVSWRREDEEEEDVEEEEEEEEEEAGKGE